MECLKLYDLIKYLELGTKLHIGVLFFGNYGNEMCELPFSHQIHSSPFCTYAKSNMKNGYRRCFSCRNLAIEKALETKKAFGGICINGLYEYAHPVLVDDEVACIIFIGNISGSGRNKTEKKPAALENTLEKSVSECDCMHIAKIIESYVFMLFENFCYTIEKSNPLVENIKNYILSNIEFDINISHISKVFHYNEMYLGRLFKKETGQTICNYVNKERVEIAKKLLMTTDEKIIDISGKTGFNNVTYFNRVFKAFTGKTPMQYRRG